MSTQITTVKNLLNHINNNTFTNDETKNDDKPQPCNNCYYIGWMDNINPDVMISYAGHIILTDCKASVIKNGYCVVCGRVDEYNIHKKDVFSFDTACNCRLNLCLKHFSEMSEQNK